MEKRLLDCWIFGQPYDTVSTVNIPMTATVYDLKEVIKDRTVMFRDVETAYLHLYCIPSPDDEHLQAELEQWTAINQRCLSSRTKVSVCLPATEQQWLIIVVHPPIVIQHSMNLTCWVRGEGTLSFPVLLSSNDTVGHLQRAVKAERPDIFDAIPALRIRLYQVPNLTVEALEAAAEGIESQEPLHGASMLSDLFSQPIGGRIHVMVHPSPVGLPVTTGWVGEVRDVGIKGGDDAAAFVKVFRDVTSLKGPPPSVAAKSAEYAKIQAGPLHILDCRYAVDQPVNTVAPPIQLFNPAFAFFSSKAFDPTYIPPVEFVRNIRRLMNDFTPIYNNETRRRHSIKEALSRAIGVDLITMVNPNIPDYVARTVHNGLRCYPVIVEEKNEFGSGGSDPSVRASFSYIRLISQKETQDSLLSSGCPAFIIANAGPWLSIMGGIVLHRCIVQRLTDYVWVPFHSTHDDDQCLRMARIFYVLRESIDRLDSWYQELDIDPKFNYSPNEFHPRFWPSPRAYKEQGTGTLVNFVYHGPFAYNEPNCVTYFAKTDKEDIVVKFVTSYGADVHAHMASEGFAPRLLYYGKINMFLEMPSYGKLRMVVMERVKGWSSDIDSKRREIPTSFKSDLERAIKHLHNGGYVSGDLRMPNIMVVPKGTKSTAQLIDFDWAGKQGQVKYPITINGTIAWPPGVEGEVLIEKEHDEVMLRNMLGKFP